MRTVLLVPLLCLACDPEVAREVVPEPAPDMPSDYPDTSRVVLNPKPVDFGVLQVGEVATVDVELVNEWDGTLYIEDVTLLPAGEGASLDRIIHDDIREGLALEPGESYTVTLEFEPEEAMAYTGRLELVLPANARKSATVTGVARHLGDSGL